MKHKVNCWEFDPDHRKMEQCLKCPAFNATHLNGLNGGKNGGRVCWAIRDTLCGTFDPVASGRRYKNCKDCPFFALLLAQETDLATVDEIFRRMGKDIAEKKS